ncbi:hypothetical protein HDV63DRAFT_336632 [Trichoderma sp. SZMC 28014]
MLTLRCPACELYACHDRQGGHLTILLYGVTSAWVRILLTSPTGIYTSIYTFWPSFTCRLLSSFFIIFRPVLLTEIVIIGLKAAFFLSCILVN